MRRYLAQRILGLVPVFFGITVVSFAVMHLAPGRPTDQTADFNPRVSPAARERLNELYGLNDPLHVQYGRWVSRLARGDFGRSFHDGQPVLSKIAQRLPVTVGVNAAALLVALGAALPLGIMGAARAGSRLDHVLTLTLFIGFSIPTFWLALVCLDIFGVKLQWVPVSGIASLMAERWPWWRQALDRLHHVLVPIGITALGEAAILARYLRGSLIEVLRQDYILLAYAQGLSRRRVLYRHALPNALLPFVTLLGLAIPGLVGGSVVLESVFALPGIGRLFVESVMGRDYPVILGLTVLGSLLTLGGNLLADVAYAYIDPRVRYEPR